MADATNHALWQDATAVPGVVRASPFPSNEELGDQKVLVKVNSWAINPCDYMLQLRDLVAYPLILGCDIAGVVEAVSPNSSAAAKFHVGDRVFGFAANNGFQDFVSLEHKLMAKIPDNMAFREAVVFGLCSATCAMYLFGKDYLHLDYPKSDAQKKEMSVLIWGGSSAVGSNAIQLCAAAGYDVITTCSKNNFDYAKQLGATQVFDYKDADVTERISAVLDKSKCAGIFMAAGLKDGNVAACKVAASCKQRLKFASSNFIENLEDVPDGVDVKQPTSFKPFPDCWFETTPATFDGYLPMALADKTYKVAPPPVIVNKKGLAGIQEAIDIMRDISENGQQKFKDFMNWKVNDASAIKLVVERP